MKARGWHADDDRIRSSGVIDRAALSVATAMLGLMSESTWRPLGVVTNEQIERYEALREDIPPGMETRFWEWVANALSYQTRESDGYRVHVSDAFDAGVAERWAATFDARMGSVRGLYSSSLNAALGAMKDRAAPMETADFLLAFGQHADAAKLEAILADSRSVWTVGERQGRRGLIRRVPAALGLEVAHLARTAGTAGAKLVQAWEAAYSISPNPSHAYAMAVKAVEDAAIPLVVPRQREATLGHVIGQMTQEGDWRLVLMQEPDDAPAGGLPLALCLALWFGQHDRHGGDVLAPGSVTQQEAEAAVSLAVTLVHWFSGGLVGRRGTR